MKKTMNWLRHAALTVILFGIGSVAFAAGYSTSGGRIYDSAGTEIQIRGINHFGFNGGGLAPQFLWSMGWKEQIAQIKSLGFNAVRLPFGPDTLHVTTPVDQLGGIDANKNGDLIGKTPLQVLDMWMAEANRQGLYVLMDFHGVSRIRQYPTWFVDNPADFNLMYNNKAYTADDWRNDLTFVAKRYASLPYFFAIDIYNEPNGAVRWDAGDANVTDPKYFWRPAAESAANAILGANPNLLIFVQGSIANFDGVEKSNLPMNWAENFQPEGYKPLNIPQNKLVLSPHTYGPDVYVKSSFSAPNYPANLEADWETLFGQFAKVYAVVPGEWGGRYGQGGTGQPDVQWQNAFVAYLIKKGTGNSFYWCYTPNSGDSGGILDDNLNVRQDKMALLQKLWSSTAPGSTPAPAAPAPTPTPTPAADATPAPTGAAATAPTPPPTPEAVPATVTPSVTASTSGSGGGGAFDYGWLGIYMLVIMWHLIGRSARARNSDSQRVEQ